MKKILEIIKRVIKNLGSLMEKSSKTPIYRVVEIERSHDNSYCIIIQKRYSSQTLKLKPETILSDDALTDSFSPRDIRTLTYLGYLGIHAPQYKILAKNLNKKDKKLHFELQQKGKKKTIVKTAEEIAKDKSILNKLSQKDAHEIGFVAATQHTDSERKIMRDLVKEKKEQSDR